MVHKCLKIVRNNCVTLYAVLYGVYITTMQVFITDILSLLMVIIFQPLLASSEDSVLCVNYGIAFTSGRTQQVSGNFWLHSNVIPLPETNFSLRIPLLDQ